MSWQDLLHLVDRGGTLAAVAFFLFANWRGWVVWGWVYEASTKRESEWKEMALHGTDNTDKALENAVRLVEISQLRSPSPRRRQVDR